MSPIMKSPPVLTFRQESHNNRKNNTDDNRCAQGKVEAKVAAAVMKVQRQSVEAERQLRSESQKQSQQKNDSACNDECSTQLFHANSAPENLTKQFRAD